MRSEQQKVAPEFVDEVEQILGKKTINKTLNKIPKNKRGLPLVTKKILKSKFWPSMEQELINNEFEPE